MNLVFGLFAFSKYLVEEVDQLFYLIEAFHHEVMFVQMTSY